MKKVSTLENAQIETTENIDAVIKRLETLETESERQEQYSRRENLILHGLTEETGETYRSLRKRATDLLNAAVKDKVWTESDILRTHRLGKSRPSSSKPRPLIIRFVQFHDKLTVLGARAQLKTKGIGVKCDLTQKQRAILSTVLKTSMDFSNQANSLLLTDHHVTSSLANLQDEVNTAHNMTAEAQGAVECLAANRTSRVTCLMSNQIYVLCH